jgi:Gpi18-like mannosyltransferase
MERRAADDGPELIGLAILAAVFVAALVVRLLTLGLDGHSGDVVIIHLWAERMAEVGPWGFYEGWISVYPALLYAYWPMGLLLDGEALDLAIKGSSIPFDLAIGLLLWVVVRRWAGPAAGLAATALYLLNPAVVIAGPMWGQIDAAGTLFFLLSLLAVGARRWATSGVLSAIAGMAKPQFGAVVIPVAATAIVRWRAGAGPRPLLVAALGGLVTYVVLAAPLLLDPLRYADQLWENASNRPFVSLFALNPWGLLVGFEIPDGGLAIIGVGLLVVGLVGATIPLWRRQDLYALLAAGTLVVFAFYFFPTRSHERYLFPAMALLAPFAAVSLRFLVPYLVLSATFAASLIHALAWAAPSSLEPALVAAMRTEIAPWAIGLPLIAAAMAITWLLLRGANAPRG